MHGMEDSASVVKKKSSSGCLIIKKKGGFDGSGSGSKKVFESRKEKKRPRLLLSDSGSSDELVEPVRRRVAQGSDKFRNGSVGYKKGFVEDGSMVRNYSQFEGDRKRGGLDVFEFDEYDRFDGKKIRKGYMDERLNPVRRDFGIGSSRNAAVDKRGSSYFDGRSGMYGGKGRGPEYNVKKRYEMENDEAHLPISSLREKYREAPDEPIRLQGKNGVLKVMVNKKKKLGLSDRSYDQQEAEDTPRKGSRPDAAVKNNVVIRPSFYSDSKRPERPVSFVRKEKSELKLRKSLPIKSSKDGESEEDGSDTALKLGLKSAQASGSSKRIKDEEKSTPPTKSISPARSKESKVKRGSGTEKQLLREQIRNMLLGAGWTIDYRPRRNRDYLDAVYINPTGTAYWSIIKAYEALQKQLEEDDDSVKPSGDSSSFAPLPEDILSKLTRQTRKKIEREMKKKRKEDGGSRRVKDAIMQGSEEGAHSDQHEEKLSVYMKQSRKSLKGRSHAAPSASGDDSSDNIDKGMNGKLSIATHSHLIQGRKSRKIGRCTLLVRGSDKGTNSETDGFVPYTGKRTLLSWLIDSGVVHMSEKVQYMNRRKTRTMLEGWITRDGIHCGCCSKILSVSKFEIHAGSKLRQPFPNIFLESGLSLMQCQIDAWNKQDESKRGGFHIVDTDGDDPNDDTCGLCGDGGDLICCDGCPSTFHQSCLAIQMLPAGDWHCPNCTCKVCGIASGTIAICSLCEKKYHESCGREVNDLPVESQDATASFCGQKCRELFCHLQKLLGVKYELEAGFSWSLIHRMDPFADVLHIGFSQTVECNSKLAVALSVMDECFLPITDRRSGVNLIHNVVYNCGSNFSRIDYKGFYTAILERGDEIVSAASIRIHGTQLAEMPYIGTRHMYRRQGMCRRLLNAIESALCSLKVEKLIIPAIAEHMHTWTEVFNFKPLEELHKQEMRSMNMLVFPGTDMLQKLVVKQEITEGSISASSGSKVVEVKNDHILSPVPAKCHNISSSVEHDIKPSDNSALENENETNDKLDASNASLQAPAILANDSNPISSSLDGSFEPRPKNSRKEAVSTSCESVSKITESAADLNCLSASDVTPVSLEIGNSVSHPPVKDDIQFSTEAIVDGADYIHVKASCKGLVLDSAGEISTRNLAKAENGSLPITPVTSDGAMQLDSGMNWHGTVEMEIKMHTSSEIASHGETAPMNSDIMSLEEETGCDVHAANVKNPDSLPSISTRHTTEELLGSQTLVVSNNQSFGKGSEPDAREVDISVSCSGPVSCSLSEISAQTTSGGVNENQSSVLVSMSNGTVGIVPYNCDSNQPSALSVDNRVHVALGLLPDTDVASDAKVALLCNTQSSSVGNADEVHDAKVAKNTPEETCEKSSLNFAPTLCCPDECNHSSALHVKSNISVVSVESVSGDCNHRFAHLAEGELHVGSECGLEAKVACGTNMQLLGNTDDSREENVNITCLEPAPVNDSSRETSAENSGEVIIQNLNPGSVITSYCSGETTTGSLPDLNQHTSLTVGNELLLASEVVTRAETNETNMQSNTEDEVGCANAVNAKVPSVEPVCGSLGEASAQNIVQAANENMHGSRHGSDGSTVQLNSGCDHQSAMKMDSELHVTTEVVRSAMP